MAFKPPFPRGLNWLAGDRSPGFRDRAAAPSRGLCVVPSGWRARRLRPPPPGHSGGTAPDSHRTSLDHRPYVRGESIPPRRQGMGSPWSAHTATGCGRTAPPAATSTGGPPSSGTGCCAAGGVAALLAVVGPGLLAGLSDDDPAGITTYSILGAHYGYELLWVLALSTAALIVFHELGVRLGIVTGKGLLTLVRERFGQRAAALVAGRAGRSPTPARSAPSSPGSRRRWSCSAGSAATSACRWRRSASRPSSCARTSAASSTSCWPSARSSSPTSSPGSSPTPTGARRRSGLVVPSIPLNRDALLVAVATRRHDAGALGPRLHPVLRGRQAAAGQGPALRARRRHRRRRADRRDRLLRRRRLRRDPARRRGSTSTTPSDAARALEPLAGSAAATLFGLGFLGAALLAAAIVPLSTAYSISETLGRRADLDDSFAEARTFYLSFGAVVARRRRHRPDPRRAADPDPLPHPGAERRPAAGPAALHPLAGQGPRADGRPRARPRRPARDRASPSALVAVSVLALGVLRRSA